MLGTGENRAHLPLMDAIAIDLAVMEPDGPDDAMGKEAGARFVPHTGEGRNVAIFRNPARKGAERHVDPNAFADGPGRRGAGGAPLYRHQPYTNALEGQGSPVAVRLVQGHYHTLPVPTLSCSTSFANNPSPQ